MTQSIDDVLKDLLAKAVELKADTLEIEYKDGQEEVCAVRGNVGVGIAVLDSSGAEAKALRQQIKKIGKKGQAVVIDGKTFIVTVSIYDSFGEEAYRIKIGKPQPKATGYSRSARNPKP